MALEISRHQLDDMVAHARDEAPLECCGVVAGTGNRVRGTYRTRNADQSRVQYTTDEEDLFRAMLEIEDVRGWQILGFYHSHPASEAFPSATDVRQVGNSLYANSGARIMIVSLAEPSAPVVRSFRITGGKIDEEPLVVVSDGADD